jgi:HD-GYP domain-containing protein (c-di-GMP phosphodiesterase class II)
MLLKLAKRILPQPSVAAVLTSGVVGVCWYLRADLAYQWVTLDLGTALLCLALAIGSIAADTLAIQISYHTKTTLGGALLFLMAVLLPPALALLVSGLATLAVLVAQKHHRGLYWVDIITDSCRLALVCLIASALYAGLADLPIQLARLGAPALTILLGDIVTMPLSIGPISGDRPLYVIRALYRDLIMVDGPQYLLAVPLAVVARQAPSVLPLLLIPFVIVYRVFRSRFHLQDNTRTLLEQMADMVDLRDPYTGGHSRRVAEYSAKILGQLGLNGDDVDLILNAARIHDIGKIGVPDAVLNKPGILTDEERRIMEQHPALGANLLLRYPDFARGVAIVRHHHERIDGKGYPDGLLGQDIPFGARVIAVADTWDALTSDRPYRKGMTSERAAAVLIEGRGTQWSPDLVDALLRALELGELIERVAAAEVGATQAVSAR